MGEETQAASEEAQDKPQDKSQAAPLPQESTKSKIIKLIVVGVYICGVCGTGFTLALYYLFFWDSRMPEIYKTFKKF